MSTSNTSLSISDAIIKDHRELKEYYGKYKSATTEKEQEQWSNQFRWELARHSVGEELLLYPAFEKHFGAEGKAMADHDRADHAEAKKLLYELERTKVTDAKHATIFKTLWDDLEEHIKTEEEHDLPKFEGVISRDDSLALAKSFSRTKNFVPTRSHPSAPDKPPFETLAGLLAAPLDKLQDLFSSFPPENKV